MKKILLAACVFLMLNSCKKNDNFECPAYDQCSGAAPQTEVQSVETYLANNNITATKHCSGMYYKVETAGTGKTPTVCSMVAVRYKGMLTNGTVFDETSTGEADAVFEVGRTVRGFANGLLNVKEGGKITLYIPPSHGYGNQDVRDRSGNVVIPANSILVFEVQLVSAS